MHKDYFEPTLNRFRCILIWIWRIWCMTYKYVISGGWRSYFLCSFIEVPKAYCNIPIHHHKLFINPVTWERTTLTLIQCRGGSNLEKIWFFGVKSWFFTRNTPKLFAPPSARRNFFKCAPPNLKYWIRPCNVYDHRLCISNYGNNHVTFILS
jgi:hypothetical protein